MYEALFDVCLITVAPEPIGSKVDLKISNALRSYEFLPANTLCIVSAVAIEDDIQSQLHEVCSLAGGIPIITHSEGLLQALAYFAVQMQRASQKNVQLLLSLSALRRVHEELQGSYDSLRSFVADRGIALPAVGFENPPDGRVVVPPDAQKIKQFIPIELREICGIGLHIDATARPLPLADVIAELYAPNDNAVLFSWSIKSDSLKPGWLSLCFEQSNRFLRRSVALRIYTLNDSPMPALSLGVPQLWEDKAAIIDGLPQDRSLAFKVWVSVPGAPLVMTTQIWPSEVNKKDPPGKLELAINRELAVLNLTDKPSSLQFPPVTKLLKRNRISVHPLSEGPTLAHIIKACPVGTQRIFAEVETDNAEAGPVIYGIGMQVDTSKVNYDHYKKAFSSPSDWVQVQAKTLGFLELRLREPLKHKADIYLMTALADQAQDWAPCWAHFTRIWFTGQF